MYEGAQAYKKMDVNTADPRRLILMLYEAALRHLFKARDAMKRKDVSGKCENLSKSIAIIGELLAAVSPDESNEAAVFLRGLYTAILAELPRANMENDVAAVELSIKYVAQLKAIWEKEVMREIPQDEHSAAAGPARSREAGHGSGPSPAVQAAPKNLIGTVGYGGYGGAPSPTYSHGVGAKI